MAQPGFGFFNLTQEETEEGLQSPRNHLPISGEKQSREKQLSSRRGWSVVNNVSFIPVSIWATPRSTALLNVASLEIMSQHRNCCCGCSGCINSLTWSCTCEMPVTSASEKTTKILYSLQECVIFKTHRKAEISTIGGSSLRVLPAFLGEVAARFSAGRSAQSEGHTHTGS